METLIADPPWLAFLNAIQRDWRESEILKGNNPDPLIEARLRESGKWPTGFDTGPDYGSALDYDHSSFFPNGLAS